jgi:hypothetical protein
MTQWWTYGLSDFLMFSPQSYWRLVARYNGAWWPGQLLGVAAALALLWTGRSHRERPALWVLALAWAWMGWAFHARIYSEIFLAAPGVALACGAQAVLLALAGALPPGVARDRHLRLHRAGMALLLLALVYPLLAPLTGHPWTEAEVFGFMPEPTALATLGVLLHATQLARWQCVLLAVIPCASLLLGAATRWLIA